MKKIVLFILIYISINMFFMLYVNCDTNFTEEYTIEVPAKLAPGESGNVTLRGTWGVDKKIIISVDDTITLTNSLDITEKQTLDIAFDDIKAIGNNSQEQAKTGNISVEAMPSTILFGTWTGRFNYTVEQKEVTYLYDVLKDAEGTYTQKYTGDHQDSYTKAATHDIYHFYASDDTVATEVLDKNNVLFANHCWQMIRTTDTGGVKLIYNGEPDSNGSCGTDRGTHVGYSGTTNQTLSSGYYYGTDYTYDSSTSTFSLSGTKTLVTWSDSTYSDLVGKYTCLSAEENGTCTTLYLIESYVSNSQAKTIKIVSTSSYSQFGTVPFNSNINSPAYVGYMYGDVYTYSTITKEKTINYHYGESVTYDGEEYTLVNPKTFTSTPAYTDISNNHYICLIQNTDKCDKVGYVYYYSGSTMYYITLNVGETDVNTALNNMLTKNTTSSTMKNAIDAWYEKNLLEYDEYIEQDAIYCNDRSIKALNGWNPKGGLTNGYLQFKEYSVTKDLSCTNNTDKFSVSNTSAKLKYPIGLATSPEMNLLNNATLRKTGSWYWVGSPYDFTSDSARVRSVNDNGNISGYYVGGSDGVRPVVSLVSSSRYSDGDGSTTTPYIIE